MRKLAKTQVLVTDLDTERFTLGWPRELEQKLFKEQFPEVSPEYYTPLPFLHRIIIILRSDIDANKVYEFLQRQVKEDASMMKCKVFLTESLISKPRSRSFDDKAAAACAALAQRRSASSFDLKSVGAGSSSGSAAKPVLKVNTSCSSSDLASSSSASLYNERRRDSISSPSSLSPEQPLSPTKVKLRDDQEEYFYMEPAPAVSSPVADVHSTDSQHEVFPLQNPSKKDILKSRTTFCSSGNSDPRSPSITITTMF